MQCHEKGMAKEDLLAEIGKVMYAEYNNSLTTDGQKPPPTKTYAAKNYINVTSANKTTTKQGIRGEENGVNRQDFRVPARHPNEER